MQFSTHHLTVAPPFDRRLWKDELIATKRGPVA
jgi:hypothetical protein